MKCNHPKWRTIVKHKSWKCRSCGFVKTAHGEVNSLMAMRDLMPKGRETK
jgi:hypothetical protein